MPERMQAGTVASRYSEGPDGNARRLDGMARRSEGWNSGQMGVGMG
jgi:hypothetical protein